MKTDLPPVPADDGPPDTREAHKARSACLSRREFLWTAGVSTFTLVVAGWPDEAAAAAKRALKVAPYPYRRLASLADLAEGKPLIFRYPHDHPNCESFLVKLGTPAGGGVGPDGDIVAFNALCPHMGVSLAASYNVPHRLAGPCPFHLTTFDLTRHGMVVAGHATESLPQVVLAVAADAVYATGVAGLIYGYGDNLQA